MAALFYNISQPTWRTWFLTMQQQIASNPFTYEYPEQASLPYPERKPSSETRFRP